MIIIVIIKGERVTKRGNGTDSLTLDDSFDSCIIFFRFGAQPLSGLCNLMRSKAVLRLRLPCSVYLSTHKLISPNVDDEIFFGRCCWTLVLECSLK